MITTEKNLLLKDEINRHISLLNKARNTLLREELHREFAGVITGHDFCTGYPNTIRNRPFTNRERNALHPLPAPDAGGSPAANREGGL